MVRLCPPRKNRISAALIESLAAHRSTALSATLLQHPDVALATVIHVMALQVFYDGRCDETALQVSARPTSLHRAENSPPLAAIDAAETHWREYLPSDPARLFGWCLAQDNEVLRGLLAFCVAQTLNAIKLKRDNLDSESRMTHVA